MKHGRGLRILATVGGRLRSAQPHSRPAVVKEFYACPLKRSLNLGKVSGARADFAFEGFHSADGADGDSRPLREVELFHAEQRPGGP